MIKCKEMQHRPIGNQTKASLMTPIGHPLRFLFYGGKGRGAPIAKAE